MREPQAPAAYAPMPSMSIRLDAATMAWAKERAAAEGMPARTFIRKQLHLQAAGALVPRHNRKY